MPTASPFTPVDWVVLVVYLLAMVAIGLHFQRKVTSARSFFVADEKVNQWLVGLSLLGTYLSAVTMLGLPFLAFGPDNWLWAIQPPFLIITALVITKYVLPAYREAGVLSVYEYLEQKIHVSSRYLAALTFVTLGVGRMGLGLYLPAKAFSIITGFDLLTVIIVMGVVVTLYTVLGGIEAVIWIDSIQVIVFTGAALLSLGLAIGVVGADLFPIALQNNKFDMWEGGMELAKLTSIWLILQTVFETIRIYGTQQDMTQRYVTAGSTAEANRSVWISIIGYIPLAFLFYFLGTVLFVYYTVHPDPNMPNNDTLYPYFVATRLPVGLVGLVMAGIFAAAMSTISSLMNSVTTVCITDFWQRLLGRTLPAARELLAVRGLALFWGVIHIILAWWFAQSGEDVVRLWNRLMGIAANGVLGLMALAFLRRRLRPAAPVIGFVAAYVCLWIMTRNEQHIHFLLRPVVCNLVCFIVGVLVDAVWPVNPDFPPAWEEQADEDQA
ncbi:MAG TPA: hypothetical protein DCZ72_06645 [Armatimonadetes bacterium]|nr:hypothetical protein [Armatimonadota bacterium]